MSLHTLLQKISDNKPVNFERLITLLPPQYKWSDLFTITQANKKQYQVTIKDQAAFNTLIELATPAQSRASAAAHLLQSSHAVTCDSAYMLCFPALPVSSKTVPVIVFVCWTTGFAKGFEGLLSNTICLSTIS